MKIKNILFNSIFALTTLLIVLFFYKNLILSTLLLILLAITGLIKWKSKRTIIIFFLGGLFGTIAEMVAIKVGVWNYNVINFYNIPAWLFIVWGNSAAFIYQAAIEFKEKKLK